MSAAEDQADLGLLIDAARAAGAIALQHLTRDLDIEKKPDGTPVTSADLAVDAFLTQRLRAARPDYGWLSEEAADNTDRLTVRRLFMVDPIDGTRAYMRGKPWFAVSIAVVEDGEPVVGVLYAPALDELYATTSGGGATLNGEPISAAKTKALENCTMIGDGPMFARPGWTPPWPAMRIEQRNSVAYRMALVASGAADATVAMTSKHDWDLAAATLIAAEAGAHVSDHMGRSLIFNSPAATSPSLVCCAPDLAPLILARTRLIDLPH